MERRLGHLAWGCGTVGILPALVKATSAKSLGSISYSREVRLLAIFIWNSGKQDVNCGFSSHDLLSLHERLLR